MTVATDCCVADARRHARATLAQAGITDTPALEADLLLTAVTGWSRARLHAFGEAALQEAQVAALDALAARRSVGEPMAYVLGRKEFYGLSFQVTPDTLIPRPDSETLVAVACGLLRGQDAPAILDLGTGSGCLAIALACHCPTARVWATDRSGAACEVARRNAWDLGVADRLSIVVHDFHAATLPVPEASMDLVVSNPPYLTDAEWAATAPDVRGFEPRGALAAGPTGLDHYPAVIATGLRALRPGGRLVLEIGHRQAAAVCALLRNNHQDTKTTKAEEEGRRSSRRDGAGCRAGRLQDYRRGAEGADLQQVGFTTKTQRHKGRKTEEESGKAVARSAEPDPGPGGYKNRQAVARSAEPDPGPGGYKIVRDLAGRDRVVHTRRGP